MEEILAWRRSGPQGDMPLVLLHALPLDSHMFDAMREKLAHIDIITIDAPGFGESPAGDVFNAQFTEKPEDGNMGVYVRALHATLESIGVSRVIIGGVSMGGAAAAAFADTYPHMVAGLSIMDSNIDADDADTRTKRQQTIETCLAGQGYETIKDWPDTMLSFLCDDDTRRAFEEELRAVNSQSLAWANQAQYDRRDRRGVIEKLNAPIFLLRGRDDATCPRSRLEEWHARSPYTVRIAQVLGAGHFAPLEQPEACAHLVEDFYHRCLDTA